MASKWQKPSGLTVIPGHDIHRFLRVLPVGKVWGIGHNTAALLEKYGIQTALDFARKPEVWVKKLLTKPFYKIWQELNGRCVLPLVTEEKSTYQSIQKVKTFTPPSRDRAFVFAQLSKNIENACIKARQYKLAASGALIFLKTQQFVVHSIEVNFSRATAFPHEILHAIEPAFAQLFQPQEEYRATGIVLVRLEEDPMVQLDLFGEVLRRRSSPASIRPWIICRRSSANIRYFWAPAYLAQQFAQHAGVRGMRRSVRASSSRARRNASG